MDSGTACGLAQVEPSSTHGAERDVSASPCEYVSLRRSVDFSRVISSGRRIRRGAVTVIGAPGETGTCRVGLVVGRSVGGAVERNRAKRRLRHALQKIPLEQGMDYVIIADRRVVTATFDDLVSWLADGVDRLR